MIRKDLKVIDTLDIETTAVQIYTIEILSKKEKPELWHELAKDIRLHYINVAERHLIERQLTPAVSESTTEWPGTT